MQRLCDASFLEADLDELDRAVKEDNNTSVVGKKKEWKLREKKKTKQQTFNFKIKKKLILKIASFFVIFGAWLEIWPGIYSSATFWLALIYNND